MLRSPLDLNTFDFGLFQAHFWIREYYESVINAEASVKGVLDFTALNFILDFSIGHFHFGLTLLDRPLDKN